MITIAADSSPQIQMIHADPMHNLLNDQAVPPKVGTSA